MIDYFEGPICQCLSDMKWRSGGVEKQRSISLDQRSESTMKRSCTNSILFRSFRNDQESDSFQRKYIEYALFRERRDHGRVLHTCQTRGAVDVMNHKSFPELPIFIEEAETRLASLVVVLGAMGTILDEE